MKTLFGITMFFSALIASAQSAVTPATLPTLLAQFRVETDRASKERILIQITTKFPDAGPDLLAFQQSGSDFPHPPIASFCSFGNKQQPVDYRSSSCGARFERPAFRAFHRTLPVRFGNGKNQTQPRAMHASDQQRVDLLIPDGGIMSSRKPHVLP